MTIGDKLFLQSDSSMITVKAVSAALAEKMFIPVKVNRMLSIFSIIVDIMGEKTCLRIIQKFLKNIGINENLVDKVSSEIGAEWVISQYRIKRKFDTVVIGAPSGGIAHLSTLLNAPFLTQHFLICPLHPETNPDDKEKIVGYGKKIARRIRDKDPTLEIIIHYDPVHDRVILKHMSTIRIKLTRLPRKYREFIKSHLGDEGTILFLDVVYPWRQQVLDENIHLQIGGLGGISDIDFLYGNERLDEWLARQGSKYRSGWAMKDYPIEQLPESEWGTYYGLEEDIKSFAGEQGYRFEKIRVVHPQNISEITAHVFLEALKREDIDVKRIFFDCFTAINPIFNIETSTLPVWLPFNCFDSYSFAEQFIDKNPGIFRKEPEILLTLVPSFTKTPDQVPVMKWIELLSKHGKPHLIAVNERHYPFDIAYYLRYPKELKKWKKKWKKPIKTRVSVKDVLDIYERIKNSF